MPKPTFDSQLIQRYDQTGPRYTSYPTALQFDAAFDGHAYRQQAQLSGKNNRDLSLYFHLPFCDTVCFYCACNKIVTKNRKRAQPYLDYLHKEIQLQAELFDDTRKVEQLHWGGGTPTFISHEQMQALMQTTREHFNLHDDDNGEYSIEIDPREANADTIALLRELGFNRLSLGVQDIEPKVQQAVNRIQPIETTLDCIHNQQAACLSYNLGRLFEVAPGCSNHSLTIKDAIYHDPSRLMIVCFE